MIRIPKESPINIENKFNIIKKEINNIFLQQRKIPPENLFQQLDKEFEECKKKYGKDDQVNLLHLEHNYYWSKSIQYLEDDPNESLSLFVIAISKLIERNNLIPYGETTLERMLSTYEVVLIKIKEKGEIIDFDKVESEIRDFLKHSASGPIKSNNLTYIVDLLIELFVNKLNNKVDDLRITYSNIKENEVLDKENDINFILSILNSFKKESPSKKESELCSNCYELLYKLRKKQLHFWVNSIYLEKDKEKKQKGQNEIDQITKEMVNSSRRSIEYAKNFIKDLSMEKQDYNIKLMITLKELDKLTAEYYIEAYSKKDILKAWILMNKIKSFLVKKSLKENIPLSDNLLRYYDEEWALLNVFTQICLLKIEVNKRRSSLSQGWEKNIFEKIKENLEIAESFFKYEMINTKDYALKTMTSTFAGRFSEYFIHELFQEFCESGLTDDKTPFDFRKLLEYIRSSKKEDILLNDVIETGEPDIDIHIKNKCSIFIKNAKIDGNEKKKIEKEIELCNKKGIYEIFYFINFIKNINKLEDVRKYVEDIRNCYVNINLEVFDIKDVVDVIINELKKRGKSKLNFPKADLFRILDY